MSVRTDTINLNVNVNGNQAQNQLNDLRKKAADTRLEMEGLKKGTQAFADKKKELATITSEMDNLKKQIGLTSLTQKELIQELTRLKSLKGSVVPFTKEFKDLQTQIEAVESRLYDVKNGVQGFASFFSKIKDEVKQFGVAAAAYLGFQFITSQFQNIISGAGKLSDSLADVRKSTGLSVEGVGELNSTLGKFDTRTTNQSLRDLAIQAGKLGIDGKKNILDFVQAGDQINVALGEDLGKDAVQDIGKLVDIFRTKEEFGLKESMLKVGSAINDVGANSSASEGYIVDFLKRMGGIGPAAKIPLPDLIALAGTMDSLGQTSESSTTAIGNTISKLVTDFDGFAKIAGITGDQLKKTFNEKGGLAALQQVLEGVKKSGGNFDDLVAKLGDVGIEGAKAKGVFAVLANNLDVLDKQIKVSGQSYEKGISLTNEFNIKNVTFGATLDKLGKEFNSLLTSPGLTNFLKDAANGTMNFIKFLKDLPQWLNENRTTLILLTGVILAYITAKTKATQASLLNRLATLLETGADKLDAAQKAISAALTTAYAYAKDVLTGKIKIATVAQQLWNAALKANPLGVIILLITAVAAAVSFLQKKYTELNDVQKLQQDIQKKALQSTADEEARIRSLSMVVGNSAVSLDARKKALEELIAINPQYLSGLTLENIKTQEGINILGNYVKALREKAMVQAATEAQAEKIKEDIRLQQLQYGLEKKVGTGKTDLSDLSEEEQGFVGSARKNFNFTASVTDLATGDNAAKEAIEAIKVQRTKIQVELDVTDDIIAKNYAKTVGNIDKGNAKTVTESGASVVRTIKLIKEQIKALEDNYETIDVSNLAALKKNRDQRAQLQKELDALEGKEPKKSKSERKEESEYDRLKKEAAKFAQDLKKLRQEVDVNGLDTDRQEIQRIENKYAELTDRAKKYFVKHITTKVQYQEQEVELEALFDKELQALIDKRLEKQNAKEYDDSLKLSADFFDQQRNLAGQNYASGLTDKKAYENALKDLDQKEAANRVIIAKDYSATVKKAAEDVKTFTAQQEKEITKNAIEESEKRKEIQDQQTLAEARIGVLKSRPGTSARLQAEKTELQIRFQQETEYMDKRSAMYLEKEIELQQQIEELEKQNNLQKIDNVMQYVGYFSDALNSLNQFITNRENKALAEERKRNNEKKKDYKGQLDNKLISKTQYDRKTQALDDEQQRKESETRRKQAQREKALNIFNALISNASAILKTMASVPYPFNIPLAVAQGVAGGLQIAAIANTPLPELGTGDWLRTGPKHKDKEKGTHVLIERDEAVMSAAAMTDDKVYSVTGTTAQITSALNSRNGGVNWAGGAVVQMPKWRTERPASINPNMPRIMEQGGLIRPIDGGASETPGSEETNALLRQLINKQEENTAEIKTMKTKLHAVVSIKEYREEEAKYDTAKKVSGLKQ